MERRLAAILAADVVGYSRLVRADEEDTLARVKALLGELIGPKIAEHRGRVVKLMGDGVLAEFASVVDAVRAAAEIQSAAPARNAGLPADRHIEMRIGINLGDVVIDDDDIHGDGVNVAARLEALAPPGGICISGAVCEQVRDRIDLRFEDTGAQKVKNIDRPIDTHVWRPDSAAPLRTPAPVDEPSRLPTVAFAPLDAVGRNEDAETLATATSEAVVAALSNQTGISLITDPSEADYLVKGGVQARGSRYRATVQVHDCRSGDQFAADRFDRDPGDMFDAQDELASRISTTVRFAILAREYERADKGGEVQDSTQALLTKAGGLQLAPRHADWTHARELVDLVIAREPANFMALAMKAWTHLADALCGFKELEPPDRTAAVAAARQAVRLNEQSDFAHLTRAIVYLHGEGDADSAKREGERMLELNPNYPMGLFSLGLAQIFGSDAEEGVALCRKAYEANPRLPMNHALAHAVAMGNFVLERYAESVEWSQRSDQHESDVTPTLLALATAAYHGGQRDLASATADRLTTIHPDITLGALHRQPFREPETWQRFVDGLRGAGLPE